MKFIKKHKIKMILTAIALGIIVVVFILLKNLLFSANDGPIYGNRLDEIEQVEIEDSKLTEIESGLLINDGVKKANAYIQGRIVNISVDVSGIIIEDAELLLEDTLTSFTEEVKAYYDIQYFLTNDTDEESEGYPAIGYKNKASDIIIWTN